jgi:hypothetical protein
MSISKFCGGIAGVVFLYLASVGPMDRLAVGRRFEGRLVQTLRVIYFPVIWADRHNRTVDDVLVWYCKLWLPPQDGE